MESILNSIRTWFLDKEEHFTEFAKADTRLEGWLKAELIVLLSRLKKEGTIDDFEREANILQYPARKQIDFRIHIKGVAHLCELKAICISQSAGTPRNLQFYFRNDNVGIKRDFQKLDSLGSGKENKWVLGFIYPSPKPEDWAKAVASIPGELKHWYCITTISDFPNYLFISLWKELSS